MMIDRLKAIMTVTGFFMTLIILFLVFRPKRAVTERIRTVSKNRISNLTLSMFLISIISSVIMYFFYPSTTSGIIVFVLMFYLLPYVVLSTELRKREEEIFKNLIVYVNNMIVTLRQNKNVFNSLNKVLEDLEDPVKSDLELLIESLEYDLNSAKEVFKSFENKYSYTIIKQLDVILLKMHFEDSSLRDDVLNILSADVYKLSNDIEDNKAKRTTLRIEFIFISVACLVLYFAVSARFAGTMVFDGLENQVYIINVMFIISILLTLFFVDQYFNSHLMKE